MDYKDLFGKTWIGFFGTLQCAGTIKAYLVKHGTAFYSIALTYAFSLCIHDLKEIEKDIAFSG